ncbi:hypothetical protein BDA99DRAFT_457379 [Phascolomyces articulosus]|uniref:Uncharacterized protein n=1 Tax=Phascolomyces articulosus TaxID=60185 RepID=A0AAD5K9K2_9FUNG|nr:hypothetical protein BDA99DRAFT_457379 [Phascolomyces articulosus]
MRICYYELLSVERTATDLELKKAYRRQALIWHPDKNGDRVQEATERFAMIQEAYEVLSDPHERTWYDGHRDSILRGDDIAAHKDSSAGTTSEDLMRYFSMSEVRGFGDDDKGYFSVYRKLFEKLCDEEESAYNCDPPDDGEMFTRYPMFGNSKTHFADNDGYRGYGAYARDFYAAWMNFSSVKSFQWMDKWRLKDAPNRFVRRAMEKENRKAREVARKEYNDTVRSLASFVRKRDPRYKKFQEEEQKRREAAAAEQKARAQREKEELQAQVAAYKEQEWAKVDQHSLAAAGYLSHESEEDEEIEDGSGAEETDFYCVVCDKFYKSEQQYTSHESSRKHVKLAEKMKREMMADEENFDFKTPPPMDQDDDEDNVSAPQAALDMDEEMLATAAVLDEDAIDDLIQEDFAPTTKSSKKKKKGKKAPKFGIEEEIVEPAKQDVDDLSALTASLEMEQSSRRKRRNGRKEGSSIPTSTPSPAVSEDVGNDTTKEEEKEVREEEVQPKESGKTKREKRKEKKKQKEEKAIASELLCNVCGEDFSTRNQLFNHIKNTGHALAVPLKQSKNKRR